MRPFIYISMLYLLAFSGTAQADARQGQRHERGNNNGVNAQENSAAYNNQQPVENSSNGNGSFVGVIYKGDSTNINLPVQQPQQKIPAQVADPFH